MSGRNNNPYAWLQDGHAFPRGSGVPSDFMDSRDGRMDRSIRDVNEQIAPYTREGLNVMQPPVGSVLTEANFSTFDRAIQSNVPQEVGEKTEEEIARATPQAVYSPGEFGDMIFLPVTFLGGESILVLQRPKGTRQSLLIQNLLPQLATNNIVVSFGIPAAVGNGPQIPPGGNWYLDRSTPQSDLYILAPAAGVVMIGYMNTNPGTLQPLI